MRIVPVIANAAIHNQRHGKFKPGVGRAFHHRADDGGGLRGLGIRDFEQQFIMHLKQHGCVLPGFGQGCGDADHGALDNVGSTALDRRVDRLAFGIIAPHRVLVEDARQVDAAAEQ